MATKKTARRPKTERKESAPKSMPAAGKDPQGGLTAKGREYFNRKEGSHLRPGVRGPADTPEKMVRKGSFLRRHFANPRGPMKDDKGEPTRLALSAHAWGEPVPQTMGDARKLAKEGHELLEQYHEIKGDAPRAAGKASSNAAKKPVSGKGAAKKARAKTAAAKQPAKRAATQQPAAVKKSTAKRATVKKAAKAPQAARGPAKRSPPKRQAKSPAKRSAGNASKGAARGRKR